MIAAAAVRKAVALARDAARVVTQAGSHAAWWLDYRVRGRSRR